MVVKTVDESQIGKKHETSSNASQKKPSEFRAEIIPYTSEDPNSPILATSGGNLNLIFSIPKESFRNLAFAVINHLEDSNQKSTGNLEVANNETTSKVNHSENSHKSSLTDLPVLDTSNTNEIINSSEGVYESRDSSKDPWTDELAEHDSYCDGCSVVNIESVSNDVEINTSSRSDENAARLNDSSDGFITSSFKIPKSSNSTDRKLSNPESVQGLSIECGEQRYVNAASSINDGKQCEVNPKMTSQKDGKSKCVIKEDEVTLSECNADTSREGFPEQENTWPDIHPFIKTEEIPVKEFKSLEFNGVLTKYLKLDFLDELVVIRVTGESNVLVDAMKYKEAEKYSVETFNSNCEDSNLNLVKDLPEKEIAGSSAGSFICNVCTKSISLTTLNDVLPDCKNESQNVFEMGQSGSETKKQACASETVTEETKSNFGINETTTTESLESENLEIESENLITSAKTLKRSSCILVIEDLSDTNLKDPCVKKSEELDTEVKHIQSPNSSANIESFADQTSECGTPDKYLGMQFEKMIDLKVEQKLEEFHIKVPGNSPTERLRFTLNDSLQNHCNGDEEIKASSPESSLIFPKYSVNSLPSSSSENDIETRGGDFTEVNSLSVAEVSHGFSDFDKLEQSHQIPSEFPGNALSKTEVEICPESLSKSQLKDSFLNECKTSPKISGDYTETEESSQENSHSASKNLVNNMDISLEETNLNKSDISFFKAMEDGKIRWFCNMNSLLQETNLNESDISFEESNSSKKHLLNNCLNESENEVQRSDSQLENIQESKEANSHESLASVQSKPQEIKDNHTKENGTSDDAVDVKSPSKNTVVQNETHEKAKFEEIDQKVPMKSKIELSEKVLKINEIEDEEKLPENILRENDSTEKITGVKLDADKNVSEENLENAGENIIDKVIEKNIEDIHTKVNGTCDYAVDAKSPSRNTVVQNETHEKEKFEEIDQKVPMKSKIELSEKVLEINAIEDEEKLPENILGENGSTEKKIRVKLDADKNVSEENLENAGEKVSESEPDKHSEEECEEPVKTDFVMITESSQSSPKFSEDDYELKNSTFKIERSDDTNAEVQNKSEESLGKLKFQKSKYETNEVNFHESTHSAAHDENDETHSVCSENQYSEEKGSENYLVVDTSSDPEMKHENSFMSNGNSLMDTINEPNVESMSEGGDFESDDVKSVASESDDSKDSETHFNIRKKSGKGKCKTDEIDCAPTRVRARRAISGLSKDVIPEHAEVKNTKTTKTRSDLNVSSKYSGKTSPIGRSLRSKSLDPSPQHSNNESEEVNRKKRATTPDVIAKKDIKTAMRSSPRKLVRSAAAAESKVPSTKVTFADTHSKSRANLDSSTSKRPKRGSKD